MDRKAPYMPCAAISLGFLLLAIGGSILTFYVISLNTEIRYLEAELTEMQRTKINTEVRWLLPIDAVVFPYFNKYLELKTSI